MTRASVVILTSEYRPRRAPLSLAPDERITDYVTSARNFIAVTNARGAGQRRTHRLQAPIS